MKELTLIEKQNLNGGENDIVNAINWLVGFMVASSHAATPMYGMEHDNCHIHDNNC